MDPCTIRSEQILTEVAHALAGTVELSQAEIVLLNARESMVSRDLVEIVRASILAGGDPLGEAFSAIRSAEDWRNQGQTFTPKAIVEAMIGEAVADAEQNGPYTRIVDAGLGSGLFLRAAAEAFPDARLVGIEVDPLCALMARATLAVLGLSHRLELVLGDFRGVSLPQAEGRTLFIGNPPYVRHHDIGPDWKELYKRTALRLGATQATKLAGLHVHFFIRIAEITQPGDFGVLVTAAEWLQTGYGQALREIVLGPLGGRSVLLIDPKAEPFPGTMTTAAITSFAPGTVVQGMMFAEVADLATLRVPRFVTVTRGALEAGKWSVPSPMAAPAVIGPAPAGRIGDLFKVSRGQVTGNNAVFVVGPSTPPIPERFMTPCVTAAEELFTAADRCGFHLTADLPLKMVVTLPSKIGEICGRERKMVDRFLAWAKERGAHISYTAESRKDWHWVALHAPPPIIVTYMARRPAAFIRNDVGARVLNIAHRVVPKIELTSDELDRACDAMNEAARTFAGRVYAGGLKKLEPSDVESIPIDWGGIGLPWGGDRPAMAAE